MFKIRPEMMDEFGRKALAEFETRVEQYVRQTYPAEAENQPDTAVSARVRETIRRALGYGLVAEQDVVRFVDFSYSLWDQFELDPGDDWARRILTDPELSAVEKLDTIQGILDDIEGPAAG